MPPIHISPDGPGDEEAAGRKGDYLLKPRGVPHAMWNAGDSPNHFIEIITPGDGDGFFRDLPTTPDGWAQHGIEWFDDWTGELRTKYRLA